MFEHWDSPSRCEPEVKHLLFYILWNRAEERREWDLRHYVYCNDTLPPARLWEWRELQRYWNTLASFLAFMSTHCGELAGSVCRCVRLRLSAVRERKAGVFRAFSSCCVEERHARCSSHGLLRSTWWDSKETFYASDHTSPMICVAAHRFPKQTLSFCLDFLSFLPVSHLFPVISFWYETDCCTAHRCVILQYEHSVTFSRLSNVHHFHMVMQFRVSDLNHTNPDLDLKTIFK